MVGLVGVGVGVGDINVSGFVTDALGMGATSVYTSGAVVEVWRCRGVEVWRCEVGTHEVRNCQLTIYYCQV